MIEQKPGQARLDKPRDHVARITLDNPARKNALSYDMGAELTAICEGLQQEHDVRAVVLTGAGDTFSAGGDVKRMAGLTPGRSPRADVSNWHDDSYTAMARRTILALAELERPVIAAVSGAAYGWGMDIALACDIRIASATARFQSTFVRRGAVSGTGATYLLPRLIGHSRAAELLFTARTVGAEEAERIGLVSSVCEPGELEEAALALAAEIALAAPLSLRLTKRALQSPAGQQGTLRSALTELMYLNQIALASADHSESAQAYLERRPPNFTGE
jgi:enoyl-CoA hydratase/carnithine racemase